MKDEVKAETVSTVLFAAVRVRTPITGIASAWKPALDQVWAFLGTHPEVRKPGGHNVFLYHHPSSRDQPMDIDFGVEVAAPFESDGPVRCTQTPAGDVAMAVHHGPYAHLARTHNAIHAWCREHGKQIGACSWETYGDWSDDPSKLEVTIRYLLR